MRIRSMLCLALFAILAGSAAGIAAEPDRQETLALTDRFDDVYLVNRIEAYREVGKLTNAEVLAEFGFVERLLEVARSQAAPRAERIEALRSLVRLTLNQMTEPNAMLTNLAAVITDSKTPKRIRVASLELLREFGQLDDEGNLKLEALIRDIHKLLADIAGAPTDEERNPRALRIAAIETLGALAPADAGKVFSNILSSSREKDLAVREAAVKGLRYWIRSRKVDESRILDALLAIASDADAPEEAELRLLSIECMEALIQNGARINRPRPLYEFLYDRFRNGNDRQLIAASRCLLRLADPEELGNSLRVHIEELRKGTNRGPEAKTALFMGLIEFFHPLARIAGDAKMSRSRRGEAQKNAGEIVQFLSALLRLDRAPLALRRIAARGLGLMSPVLDRTAAAEGLLAVLAVEGTPPELLEEAELSLAQLTDREPFRTEEDAPDIDTWRQWIAEHPDVLQPEEVE